MYIYVCVYVCVIIVCLSAKEEDSKGQGKLKMIKLDYRSFRVWQCNKATGRALYPRPFFKTMSLPACRLRIGLTWFGCLCCFQTAVRFVDAQRVHLHRAKPSRNWTNQGLH